MSKRERLTITYFQKRLQQKIEKETGFKVRENSFIRTYAGKNQKSAGAFLWFFMLDCPSGAWIGSCFTATECLRKDRHLIAIENVIGEYEIFPEDI